MTLLLRQQQAHVAAGQYDRLEAGVLRHEEILRELCEAELDIPPSELADVCRELEMERIGLLQLLEREGTRVDFLLRLVLGSREVRPASYASHPGWRPENTARMLNHRA